LRIVADRVRLDAEVDVADACHDACLLGFDVGVDADVPLEVEEHGGR
jgi:hypothetical protein